MKIIKQIFKGILECVIYMFMFKFITVINDSFSSQNSFYYMVSWSKLVPMIFIPIGCYIIGTNMAFGWKMPLSKKIMEMWVKVK